MQNFKRFMWQILFVTIFVLGIYGLAIWMFLGLFKDILDSLLGSIQS